LPPAQRASWIDNRRSWVPSLPFRTSCRVKASCPRVFLSIRTYKLLPAVFRPLARLAPFSGHSRGATALSFTDVAPPWVLFPSALETAETRFSWVCLAQHAPPSEFLTLSTVFVSCDPVALSHATGTPGISLSPATPRRPKAGHVCVSPFPPPRLSPYSVSETFDRLVLP
jgi:hypothetical protein